MGFSSPIGLLAFLAVPAVLVLHLFRRRFRERSVAGLFLFAADALPADAGRTRARLLRTPSLWLELLAAVLFGLLLSGFHVGAAKAGVHLVVVLDDSASMGAADASGAVRDDALAYLERRLDALDEDARVTLVRTGRRPSLLAGPRATVTQARRALESWKPIKPVHDPASAWELGVDLAGSDGELLFLTDREDFDPPPRYRHLAFGRAIPNAAVVGARRVVRGEEERVFADLLAWGSGEVAATVHLEAVAGDAVREITRKDVVLRPRRALHVAWTVPAGDIPFRVRLSDDGLAADNTTTLLPEPARVVPVHVDVDEQTAAQLRIARVFAALPGVRVVDEVERARLRVTAGDPGIKAGVVTLRVAAAGGERDAWIGPFLLERGRMLAGEDGRPVLQGLTLEGVVWSAGRGELPGLPLVLASEQVLLAEESRAGGTQLHLNLDPARSNLAASPDWPILMSNIVEHVRGRLPGPVAVNVRVGEEIALRFAGTPEAASTHALLDPEGERHAARGWRYLSWAATRPGIHRLVQGEQDVARFAVNFVDAVESDLTRSTIVDVEPVEVPDVVAASAGPRGRDEARIFALLLLLAVVFDWWVLGRRR